MLVTNLNPLTIWLFNKPYLRFGAEDYDDNISNLYAHLTNNSIVKYSKKFNENKIIGNMWEIEQFALFLNEKYGRDVWVEIKEKIKKLVIVSLDCCVTNMNNRKNSFELLGYDVMVDTDLNVWLIEVNSSPAMDYSTVIEFNLSMLLRNWLKLFLKIY